VTRSESATVTRVATWNLWWRYGPRLTERLSLIEQRLFELRPDVLALQEVWCDSDPGQAEQLAEMLNLDCVFYSRVRQDGYEWGNAVLCRRPIGSPVLIDLPGPAGERGQRSAILVRANVADRHLVFVVTHLSWRFGEVGVRLAQLEKILNVLSSRTEPILLCGDLNSTPESEELSRLRSVGRLRDIWEMVGNVDSATISRSNTNLTRSMVPDRRVDYILIRDGEQVSIIPKRAWLFGNDPRDGLYPSDHFGVAADLEIVDRNLELYSFEP
jgi:endonuclease/exonuclease/phosphatase family metal-dependent hydrolase